MTAEEIAEKCLTQYWGARRAWDTGSPAHRFAINWAKRNYKELKNMVWKYIFKQYLICLRQE